MALDGIDHYLQAESRKRGVEQTAIAKPTSCYSPAEPFRFTVVFSKERKVRYGTGVY